MALRSALIGKPRLADMTTDEMSEKQFARFREAWIYVRAHEYKKDGVSEEIANLTATNDFDICKTEEGFERRNEAVLTNRALRRERRKTRALQAC